MKNLSFARALVLGAHTDDEFACMGTILRLLESGCDVHYATFSTCEASVPEGFPPDVLAHEVRRAAAELGLAEENLYVFDYPVRHFPARRQDILEDLVRLRERIHPDVVLVPALSDIHQDHHVIAEEGLRCFKFQTVLGYELPMNTVTFEHACFVELSEDIIANKVRALKCYESQSFRPYMSEDFIFSLARVRGVQAGLPYAEAFEVLRLML